MSAKPATCTACQTSAGCDEHRLFTCATCKRLTHWRDSGADERPDDCSDCWLQWLTEILEAP